MFFFALPDKITGSNFHQTDSIAMNPFTLQELERYRALFPVTRNFVYLNHAAVAPLSLNTADAIAHFTEQALHLGYTAGPEWHARMEGVREKSATLVGAKPSEIAFTKNTSHGISLIVRGIKWKPRDEIIISDVEFPANVYPWMSLEPMGVILKKIPCEKGELQLDRLRTLVTSRTRLVSLSSVQYGNGYRLPLAEVGKFCRERGIYFLVDAIQSLGAFPLDVQRSSIDFLTADAHKWMLGPEGIGIFYMREDLIEKIEPTLLGWNSVMDPLSFDKIDFTLRKDAKRFEEGSHNTLSLYALDGCLDLLFQVGVDRIAERILYLTDLLIQGLQALKLNVTCSLKPEYRSGIVTFQIHGDEKGKKLAQLERHLFSQKIYASVRRGNLRISPHFYNSEEEIQTALDHIAQFLHASSPTPAFSS
ncbi:MAG: aminotransferase class V-fold PLP-dependent enzyme [bacterium]